MKPVHFVSCPYACGDQIQARLNAEVNIMDLRKMSVEELLKLANVPLYNDKHFVYSSGMHGPGYANLRILKDPENINILKELAYRLLFAALVQGEFDFDKRIVVVGPQTLGAIFAKVAVTEYQKRHGKKLNFHFGSFKSYEVEDGEKKFRWAKGGGFSLLKPANKKSQVIWLDDLVTKASTWHRTRHLIEDLDAGDVKIVAVIINHSEQTAESMGVAQFGYLTQVSFEAYKADKCPLCEAKKPIVLSLGHGKKFQEANPDYPGGYVEI